MKVYSPGHIKMNHRKTEYLLNTAAYCSDFNFHLIVRRFCPSNDSCSNIRSSSREKCNVSLALSCISGKYGKQ